MNLFLKKNFFIETNRSNSTSSSQNFQLNKLNNKILSQRVTHTISLNNLKDKQISSPKLSLQHNNYPILKLTPQFKPNKPIFSAKKFSSKFRTWKINSKIMIPKKDILVKKNETKIKDERIESVLSEIINWDNKQLIENNKQFQDAKLYCEKEKKLLNMQRILSENNINSNNINGFCTKTATDKKEEFKTLSRFSIFYTNYNPNLEMLNNNKKDNSLNNIINIEKSNTKFENANLDRLMKIYEYVKNNKIKKKKYKEVIDSAYNLIFQAKKECELSVDLLKERIKSLQKYYEAYIKSYSKIKDSKDRKIKLYEEKIIKYREYLSIYEEINEEIKKYEDNYNIIKVDLDSFINEIRKKIEIITKEINKYKYLFNELKEQQIEYYLDKLKKGEDTRKEGLSWIVQKLMELKVDIEPNLFPGYLDQEQIEFIIKISELDFELHQLRIILKTFKEKKKSFLKDKINNDKIVNMKRQSIKKIKLKKIKNEDFALAGDINFEIDFESCFDEFLKDKGIKNPKIIELQKKFKLKEGFNSFIKYKTEANKLNIITKRIRNKMNLYSQTNDSKLFEKIKKHKVKYIDVETEFFKDFAEINDRIEKLDEMIERLKKEEYLIFKEKIKLIRESDRQKKFEIIYNALFGEIIFDMESKYKTVFSRKK